MKLVLAKSLRKLFYAAGFLLLLLMMISVAFTMYEHFAASDPVTKQFHDNVAAKNPLSYRLSYLFELVGSAFFSFLIGSILYMLEEKKLERLVRSERFLWIICFCYVGEVVIALFHWGQQFLQAQQAFQTFDWSYAFTFFSISMAAVISVFTPILYGVTACILFYQFKQLVTFESEVA